MDEAKSPEPRAKVFDLQTGEATLIPARELAPGMIEIKRVAADGREEIGWVDGEGLRALTQTPTYRHDPFDEATRDLLLEIKAALDAHYPQTLEQWEDGFRRDTHPEKEIRMWLHLARTYSRLTSARQLSEAQRHEYFAVMLACLNAPREHVLTVTNREVLSEAEALWIVGEFYGDKSIG